jgi:glycosyltransferase involved in cell wall biosynthesis
VKRNTYESILYLSYDGLTDPLGQSQIVPYLNGLADEGWKLHVISFEKKEADPGLKKKISWHPLKYHKDPPVVSTLFDIWKLRRLAERLVKKENIEIVHCRSYITSLVGLELKRKYGVKFIFDMRGFWADERVEGGLWNLRNPVYRSIYNYFKRKEKQFLQEADHIISLTKSGKKELLRNSDVGLQTSDFEYKISVIPTCVDTDLFDPSRILEVRKSKLRREILGSKFVILTNDRQYQNDEPDIIIKSVDRQEVPEYLAICDATICFVRPTFSKKASSATKIWESLSMDKPVIVNNGWGDVDKMFTDKNLGHLISSNDEQNVKPVIRQIVSSQKETRALRIFVFENVTLETGIEKYNMVYQELTEEPTKVGSYLDLKPIEIDG